MFPSFSVLFPLKCIHIAQTQLQLLTCKSVRKKEAKLGSLRKNSDRKCFKATDFDKFHQSESSISCILMPILRLFSSWQAE